MEGLTRRYGALVAVHALDLTVRAGEVLGFLGPNGAGKTTTLRVAAGLLRADSGEVRISGASLSREPMRARARLGFVPDRPYLYERLTAREFLEFVAALYRVAPSDAAPRAQALIERLDLGEVADDLIETYSLGMKQKLSLAAAVLHDPPLLMLDEPLIGLDPRGARALKDLLRERAARGLGVLVSTHLLDVAERLCDRVLILDRGEKRAEGTLAELRGGSDASLEDVFLALTAHPDDGARDSSHSPHDPSRGGAP
ncbi:MAG TPA: ABC transporter ATP-binding protein [Candidatus Sulfotelmatobacter sp.]|nr:ABC transporter ATP-binding protein [Candidatus Sulfotelmatobacter sp.]